MSAATAAALFLAAQLHAQAPATPQIQSPTPAATSSEPQNPASERVTAQPVPPAFSIDPMRMEMEVPEGTEKTAAFEIRAEAANANERGRLVLSLTDWTNHADGTMGFAPPGTQKFSASPWVIFSPSGITLEPGRTQLVRVTVQVPAHTAPGSYQTAIFVEERPPATPMGADRRVITVRVRYGFVLYVIVPPVAAHPELSNLEVDTDGPALQLVCQMENTGNRHVRPLVVWTIHPEGGDSVLAKGKIETSVLLPELKMRQAFPLQHLNLPPGRYEASVLVDFQDGKPLQSMTRGFEIAGKQAP